MELIPGPLQKLSMGNHHARIFMLHLPINPHNNGVILWIVAAFKEP